MAKLRQKCGMQNSRQEDDVCSLYVEMEFWRTYHHNTISVTLR